MGWGMGLFFLLGIPLAGWGMGVGLYRENFGRWPWQKAPEPGSLYGTCPGWDDPEDRCPRHPRDCVCWKEPRQ
jgi:hypothetical protein